MRSAQLLAASSVVGAVAAQGAFASAGASAVASAGGASASATATTSAPAPAFTYNATDFLLHGKPVQLVGGQMDPQRIHPSFWRDRLQKARALGLNTIFSYVFWDMLEPVRGNWLGNEPQNDLAKFVTIAKEEGLNVVLRPGPYICGEHEWGGFPAWLSQIPGMVVRSNNKPFLDAAKGYFQHIADTLGPHQISKGGNILMVQVENEYGSYGSDTNYTGAIRDILKSHFDVPLYTNDGGASYYLKGGLVPGVLAEIDGGSQDGFAARDKYVTDPSELGPLLNGEYYTTWLDIWGSDYAHQSYESYGESYVQSVITDIDYTLGNASASMSFYMVHGGTNWAFEAGADWNNKTLAITSSYDYGSPIDEAGRTTPFYDRMRTAILRHNKTEVPDVPANVPLMAIPEFSLKPVVSLFDTVGRPVKKVKSPVNMESLGQAYGFVLYTHTATGASSGVIQPGDRARDRVLVYVNSQLQGVIDSIYNQPKSVSVNLKKGDKLQLLVENLGRVNYWNQFTSQTNEVLNPHKGIVGDVTVGGSKLSNWDIHSIPLDNIDQQISKRGKPSGYGATNKKSDQTPTLYRGHFKVPKNLAGSSDPIALDTYISIPKGVKGNVWVNGFHLGKYWAIGPQQSLYAPGSVIHSDKSNEVIVLELEPSQTGVKGALSAEGLDTRVWGNNPDVDCVGCSTA